jgi:DNA-binding NarL/FixJ family response regulator
VITVVIADDQALVRAGFVTLLAGHDDITVVGEAHTGRDAVSLARRAQPVVALLDIRMPDLDGIEATRQISADPALSGTRVIILTTYEQDDYVFEALRAGASGFLTKDVDPTTLLTAIRTVADGNALLAPSVTRRLVNAFVAHTPAPPDTTPLDVLSARERDVLALVGEGLSNREIADRLYLSPNTAKTHVSNIMQKLRARDRAQLVITAFQTGLTSTGA